MFYLNVMNGAYAGKQFKLDQGLQTLGRGESCQIVLQSNLVSRKHAQVEVIQDKILLSDLQSANGTFVNGLKVTQIRLHIGDKIVLSDVLLELTDQKAAHLPTIITSAHLPTIITSANLGSLRDSINKEPSLTLNSINDSFLKNQRNPVESLTAKKQPEHFQDKASFYIEEIALPGVYKLLEFIEFKWFIGLSFILFVTLISALSTFPLIQILQSSGDQDNQMRALSLARSLAQMNKQNIINELDAAVTVESIQTEPGVSRALIISHRDGRVIAPQRLTPFPEESFLQLARSQGKEFVKTLNSSLLGASVPVEVFNSQTGTQGILAYAIVITQRNSLGGQESRILSLFIQTLFISMLLGSVIFYFIYKVFIHMFIFLNKQIDSSMKDSFFKISNPYLIPELNPLIDNLNSLMARGSDQKSETNVPHFYDRNQEMSQILSLFQSPCLIYIPQSQIISGINRSFQDLTGEDPFHLQNQNLNTLRDKALQQNIMELIHTIEENPQSSPQDRLEIGGQTHFLKAQGIFGNHELSYIIVVISPEEDLI